MALTRKTFWIPLVLACAAYVALPLPGQGASLPERIEEKRREIDRKQEKEGVLSTEIERYNTRIDGLKGQISGTEERLAAVQDDLDGAREELLEVRDRLEVARDRL